MVLLDTCALLWWTLDPEKLSGKAHRYCQRIPDEGAIISSISIWEIGIKIKKGVLDIKISLPEYVDRLNRLEYLQIIPIDETIWIKNIELDWQHKDPADRTIVATAMLHDLPILTKDVLIRNYYPKTIW
jgi:PIN domain nuclease of toxin-antitoxin system